VFFVGAALIAALLRERTLVLDEQIPAQRPLVPASIAD
jgi:hypothetical protein